MTTTSFFTLPEELEQAYRGIKDKAPVSLAIVPFCRAGNSRGVPEKFRNRWTVHPLHENEALVAYLRNEIAAGRFEAMLHGYYHDERDGAPEFAGTKDLEKRVWMDPSTSKTCYRREFSVFVPPHNCIRRHGLRAIERRRLASGRSRWRALGLAVAFHANLDDMGAAEAVGV